MPDASLGDRLKSWRALVEGMKGRLEELSFLRDDHTELGALVQQIDAQITQTDLYESRLRITTRQRMEAEAQAAEIYGRLVSILKGRYGKRDLVLHEFGIQPNALPGPKKGEAKPPAPDGTPPQPTAPAPAAAQQEEPPPESDR